MNIGYGLILPQDSFNISRNLEVELLLADNSEAGLTQDPHVTIKRPFVIDSRDLAVFINYLEVLAARVSPFDLTFQGIGFFGTSTLYLKVKTNKKLTALHEMILADLRKLGVLPHAFEGPNVIFHSTLAMDLSESQFKIASAILEKKPKICMSFTIAEIGLFLNVEGHNSWVVIARRQIRKVSFAKPA